MNALRDYYRDRMQLGVYPDDILHFNGVNGKLSGNIGAGRELRDTVVLLHGPRGCGHHYSFSARSRHTPYLALECTCMGEQDVVLGSDALLRERITQVIARYRPRLVLVLPSTCSDMIQCDIRSICEEFQDLGDCRVVAVESHSFSHIDKNVSKKNLEQRVNSFGQCGKKPEFDHKGCGFGEVMCALVEQVMQPQPVQRNSVNIECLGWGYNGIGTMRDICTVLSRCGIGVHALLPSASYEETVSAPAAALNIARRLQWAKLMNRRFGTDYIHMQTPMDFLGAEGIRRFYRQIGQALHLEAEVETALEEEYQLVLPRLESLRQRFAGHSYALYSTALSNLPYQLRAYLRDYGIPLRYIIVDMSEQRVRESGMAPETFRRMVDNVNRVLTEEGSAAELLLNASPEQLEKPLEKVECVIGGRRLLSRFPELPVCPPLIQFYAFRFVKLAAILEDMAACLEHPGKQEHLLLSRFSFDENHYPMPEEQNFQASREAWTKLWTLRGKQGCSH